MKNYENQVKNMENRTDLALESYENQRKTVLPGVKVREQDGISVVEVLDARGEKALGKPVGKYRSEERRVGKECRSRWSPYH